jgi:type 1 fimbriae regulatory protein FimB/type 1 fimbriae regulatory protein FimE
MTKTTFAASAPAAVFQTVDENAVTERLDVKTLVPGSTLEPPLVGADNVVPLRPQPARRMPRRRPNAELRSREYLTEDEVECLVKAASKNRHGHRDALMVTVAFRHGLRAIELVNLKWDQVDFTRGELHVSRAKGGSPSVHPLSGAELRALRRLKREQEPKSPFVFTSERGAPFSTSGFAKLVERAGAAAGFAFKAHAHQLRHACGFALASKGRDTRTLQAYLGHRNITHTVRYTELAPGRFKNIWGD